MPTTTTTVGTAVATTTKIVQLKHVNHITANCPLLNAVMDDAIHKQSLVMVSIQGLDSEGSTVLAGQIGIKYSETGPEFDWLRPRPELEFWMERDTDKVAGPARDQSLCQVWREVMNQIMQICRDMNFRISWAIRLEGPHAQDIRSRHGLSSSNRQNLATQQVGDTLPNSCSDDMTLTVLMDPKVMARSMPGTGQDL